MHYIILLLVLLLALLTGIFFGKGCTPGFGPGDGSDKLNIAESNKETEVTPEPPVVKQTEPVVVYKINKITIERKDGKDFIRFDENEPQPVKDKEELTQLFEKALPEMNDSVEVVANGLEEFYREVIKLLENNDKKVIYSKL